MNSLAPRVRTPRWLALAAAFIFAAALPTIYGCSSPPMPTAGTGEAVDPKAQAALEAFYGLKLDVLKNADELMVYRIGPAGDLPVQEAHPLAAYPVLTPPVLATAEQRAALQKLLLDPNGYLWDVSKGETGCVDPPLVRLEFSYRDQKVDVLLRAYCWFVMLYDDGKFVRARDFDHNIDKAIKVLQQVLPHDRELMSLK